ncbi:MAG: DUF58 domain-containing protein, partial [Puniceicoccales bacterium]
LFRSKLTVRNTHWFPIFRMVVHDKFEPDLEADKLFSLAGILPGKSEVDFHYSAECYLDRGEYTLGPTTLHVSDPLGLFVFHRTIRTPQPFSVFPEVFDVPVAPIGMGSPDIMPEGTPIARAGESDLQLGVREYAPGDPYRQIHWPQTARVGELMVREYEQTTPANTYLLLDCALAGRAGTGKVSTEEIGVQLVASLAAKILRGGQPCGVLVNGEPVVEVELDYGHQHLIGILAALIPVREKSPHTLEEELARHPEILRDGSTFWLILSRVNFRYEAFDSLLEKFAWKLCRIFVILIDDEGMPSYHTTPDQRARRMTRDDIAGFMQGRAEAFYWVDAERGIENSMKEGPL